MVFWIGGPVSVGAWSRYLKFRKKWGLNGPNPVLPEDAVSTGTRSVLGALPAGFSDLYGPKDAR